MKTLKINPKHLEPMYEHLFDDVEYAGVLEFDTKKLKIKRGSSEQVITPDAVINLHTHPFKCYAEGSCVIGCPSAEDISASICFAMKGNVLHMVIAVEGIYTIQINPCFINLLKNLNDENRGLLIGALELCLKSLHSYRVYDINKKTKYEPADYMKYINNFDLEKVFNDDINCQRMTCSGVPNYDEHHEQLSFKEYIKMYSQELNAYNISENGSILQKIKDPVSKILGRYKTFVDEMKIVSCDFHDLKNKWFRIGFTKNIINRPFKTVEQKHSAIQNYKKNGIKVKPPNRELTIKFYNIEGCSLRDIQAFYNSFN